MLTLHVFFSSLLFFVSLVRRRIATPLDFLSYACTYTTIIKTSKDVESEKLLFFPFSLFFFQKPRARENSSFSPFLLLVIDDDHAKQQALINTKELDMNDDIDKPSPIYNEEQLSKVLADISTHKPITLAEAIAYQYIDLEDPKLGLANDTAQRIKNLFRPLPSEDESALNSIRIKRAGQYLADFNLGDNNTFEKFHLSEPFIYQLQQSFEPTLDFNEKQFRLLTDAILNNKEEYSNLQFDIGRTLMPVGDMKESSTNDFSQSDSGYSMTTATYESLAGKARNEFETINEPTVDQVS